MAGKPANIDWAKLETFLKAGSKKHKIISHLRICNETLDRRVRKKYGMSYADLAESLYCEGDMLLEVAQMQNALKGNTQMLIWLGKVRLGQQDFDADQKIPDKDEINIVKHHNMILQADNDRLRAEQNKPQAE